MEGPDWICSICKQKSAKFFCLCTAQETFLCGVCFSLHSNKVADNVHMVLPIQLFGKHREERCVERYQARQRLLPLQISALRGNMAEFDACVVALSQQFDSLFADFQSYRDTTFAQLAVHRAAIEGHIAAAIQEMEDNLYTHVAELDSEIAVLARKCGEDLDSLKLFFYQIDFTAAIRELKNGFKWHFVGSGQTLIPGVRENMVNLYDLRNRSVASSVATRRFHEGAAHCLIDDYLLSSGGLERFSNVYQTPLSTFEPVEITPMHRPRASHGIIKHGAAVFVFGGVKRTKKKYVMFGNLLSGRKQCEKFSILTQKWTELPQMLHPRYSFSPCYYQGLIYLASVDRREAMSVEAFRLKEEQFQNFSVVMTALRDVPISLAFVSEGELVVFLPSETNHKPQKAKWLIGVEANFRYFDCKESVTAIQCPPREFLGHVYSANLNGEVNSYPVKS